MKHSICKSIIFATAGELVVVSVAALAANPPMNARGTIAQVDGNNLWANPSGKPQLFAGQSLGSYSRVRLGLAQLH